MNFISFFVFALLTILFLIFKEKAAKKIFGNQDTIAFGWRKSSDSFVTFAIIMNALMIGFWASGEGDETHLIISGGSLLLGIIFGGSYYMFTKTEIHQSNFYLKKKYTYGQIQKVSLGFERGRYTYFIKFQLALDNGKFLRVSAIGMYSEEDLTRLFEHLVSLKIPMDIPNKPKESIYKYLNKTSKTLLEPYWTNEKSTTDVS